MEFVEDPDLELELEFELEEDEPVEEFVEVPVSEDPNPEELLLDD